ncbi:MAG: deoxynucleoside kinase [Pseudomonadales bacterium]|nr:deoxynucleoside kinase [Pseudomonadales bacterium]NRA13914.1 deoxynucleoside kinase [Oceanospirillaceae bacterium]
MLPNTLESIQQLARSVIQNLDNNRIIIAVAGAPGSGKSTLAEHLQTQINQQKPELRSQIVAMDGFHFDNNTLINNGLIEVKGSPETFDVQALTKLIKRIREKKEPVPVPIFDRSAETVIPNATFIELSTKIVIVEGNYLLLQRSPWTNLRSLFDLSVFIHVSTSTLEERLLQRWLGYGFSKSQAAQKVMNNDLVNAKLVVQSSYQADINLFI